MCFSSLHVPNRRAQKVETLVVKHVPTMMGYLGLYSTTGSAENKATLVCCIGRRKAYVQSVKLMPGMPEPIVEHFKGKRNLTATLLNRYHQQYLEFDDGTLVSVNNLVPGMRINLGKPFVTRARKPKGMKVIEQALDETSKLPVPTDKVEA